MLGPEKLRATAMLGRYVDRTKISSILILYGSPIPPSSVYIASSDEIDEGSVPGGSA